MLFQQALHAQLVNVVALVIMLGGILIFLVSLPLIYRKVPRNYVYGIHMPAAFESDECWYEIYAHGRRQMAVWSSLIIVTEAFGLFTPDDAVPSPCNCQ